MATGGGGTYIPGWAATVGDILDEGTRIKARCRTCGVWDSDRDRILDEQMQGYGPDLSLWDHHPPCWMTPGCPGEVLFLYKHGVFRPMVTT